MVADDDAGDVRLKIDNGVAWITLDRPSRLNALDVPLARALRTRIGSCRENESVRVVVLGGAGRAFCAGGDMRAAAAHIRAGKAAAEFFRALTSELHPTIVMLKESPKPTIAAINGVAAGAGMSLAAACDVRIAHPSATFKQAYTSIGLVPDGGWTTLVPEIVGFGVANHLLLADPALTAEQAYDYRFVTEVVADDGFEQRVNELARHLADGGSAGAARVLLNTIRLADLVAQLEREQEALIAAGSSSDFRERLERFVGARDKESSLVSELDASDSRRP